MQIFERVKNINYPSPQPSPARVEGEFCDPVSSTGSQGRGTSNKKAQNIVEFIFVIPMLLFLTLVIFEVALFWQDLNAVYNLNNEINATVALSNIKGLALGDGCPAAADAFEVLEAKDSMISLNNPSYSSVLADGNEPFALYEITSSNIIASTEKPQITLWVDCRNPFENGIVTQIEFYHKTLIMKATIPRFDDGAPIVVIPDNIHIASPKLNTIRHY